MPIVINIYEADGEGGDGGAGRQVERNKRAAREAVEEIWNRGNLDAIDQLTSPSARGRQAGEGMTPDDLRMAVEEFRTAFPDVHMDLEMQVAEGDYVVNFLKLTGTQQGDFRGISASGNRIEVKGISRLQYGRDGKVVDEWVEFDQYGMVQQLGAVPRAEAPQVAPREVRNLPRQPEQPRQPRQPRQPPQP
jgi:predicted ester cyclase